MTSSTQKHDSVDSDWQQIEEFVDRLHEMASSPVESGAFYRSLLEGCVTSLAAVGGAIWLPDVRGRWVLAQQSNFESVVQGDDENDRAAHYALLQTAAIEGEPQVFAPRSGTVETGGNRTDSVLLIGAVTAETPTADAKPLALIELSMRSGSSPAVQQGWKDFLATICQIASRFHTHDELRSLRADQGLHDQSLDLLHRIHKSTGLRRTAFEIANEGRRFVNADRLSVLVRRGRSWRLLAVSGADRVELRGDTAKRIQALAKKAALWGEPIDYAEAGGTETAGSLEMQLPLELAALVEQHVDQTHVRRLVAVPFEFASESEDEEKRRRSRTPFSAVLIAEQFSGGKGEFACQRVIELAALCEPALRLATQLDHFPMRLLARWSIGLSRFGGMWGILRASLALVAVAALIAALVYVPYDFEIEAPATLMPVEQRDIFATAEGTVAEVRVTHGDQVQKDQVLAVLNDPQLALDEQQVQGEIETARKRLEAIAIARTARNVREDTAGQRLPISADGQQLEKQLASLERQKEILAARRESLTLRSPIAGTLLTLDLQNLLQTRPVERGQVLFTVADTRSGWELLAEVSQDRIGHLLLAQRQTEQAMPVRFRLAGQREQVYKGHVEEVMAIAVLDSSSLEEEPPAIRVRLAVDEAELPAARPGMTAQVRFDCGQRSLGYVWLHDVWETVYSWVVF